MSRSRRQAGALILFLTMSSLLPERVWAGEVPRVLRLQVGAYVRSPVFAQPRDAGPILILIVLNRAGVPNEVLIQARDHVERIYRDIGVQIVCIVNGANDGTGLMDAPRLEASDRNALRLTIVLIHGDLADQMDPGGGHTGLALSNNGRGARRAFVFPARVNPQADKLRGKMPPLTYIAAHGLVLGHVIAHEAGHLMLPHGGHNSRGIMKALMDLPSLREALRDNLHFLPEEGNLIRAALRGQTTQR